MAKQGIHPDYHKIFVVMTDGTKYETRSTWGKEGDTITLDTDPKTHAAWVGGNTLRKTGRVEDFGKRFGAMNFSSEKATTVKGAPKKKKKEDTAA